MVTAPGPLIATQNGHDALRIRVRSQAPRSCCSGGWHGHSESDRSRNLARAALATHRGEQRLPGQRRAGTSRVHHHGAPLVETAGRNRRRYPPRSRGRATRRTRTFPCSTSASRSLTHLAAPPNIRGHVRIRRRRSEPPPGGVPASRVASSRVDAQRSLGAGQGLRPAPRRTRRSGPRRSCGRVRRWACSDRCRRCETTSAKQSRP